MRLSEANLRRAGYPVFGRDQYFVNSCGHGQEFITVPDTAGMWWLVPIIGEGIVMPSNDKPTAQAQAIIERVLGLVRERRLILRALERPSEAGESSSAEAERILYYTLMSAIDEGLIRTMEDAVNVLRHASQPLGPMGADWLERRRGRWEMRVSDGTPGTRRGSSSINRVTRRPLPPPSRPNARKKVAATCNILPKTTI